MIFTIFKNGSIQSCLFKYVYLFSSACIKNIYIYLFYNFIKIKKHLKCIVSNNFRSLNVICFSNNIFD